MIQTSVTSAVSRDISPVNARRPELPQSAEPNVDQVVIAMEATVMVVTVTGSEVEIVMVVTVVVIVMVVTVEMVVVWWQLKCQMLSLQPKWSFCP